MGVRFEASVQPVSLCPNCSRWGSDTVSRLASLHRCMLRRGIGSTGAKEVHWSTQTSSLEHRTSNAPVLRFWSVGSTGAEEKKKSTKTCSLEQGTSNAPVLIFWPSVQPVLIEFLTWFQLVSREDRPTGHRSFRQASDAPTLWHRFNRCCCFSLFWAEMTWIRMWLWLFLLPSVVLTSIDHLELFLSECARFLGPN